MKRHTSLFLLFFTWSILVMAGYFYYHKPVQVADVLALLRAGLDLGLAAWIAALAGALGRRLKPAATLPSLERAGLHAALGAGCFSLLWLLLGALHLYTPWMGWLVLVASTLLLYRPARLWLTDLLAVRDIWRQCGAMERAIFLLACALVLLQLPIALAPPTHWDALSYHLELPRQYLAAGGLVALPENPYWGSPQLTEMLYTWAMSLHGGQTAATLGWWLDVVILLGVAGFTIHHFPGDAGSPRLAGGVLAAAALLAGATPRHMLGWAYADWMAALFGLGILCVLYQWMEQPEPKELLWLGLLGGFLVSVKWTAGVLLLAAGLTALVLVLRRRRGLPALLLAGVIAVVVYLPWALKDLLATGNPFYPYLLPTAWVSAERLAHLRYAPVLDWADRIFFPLMATWRGVEGAPGYSSDVGPLLVLLAIPGLIAFRKSLRSLPLAAALLFTWLAVIGLGGGMGHLMQTRLYFAVLPAAAALAGWGWSAIHSLPVPGVRVSRIAGSLVL
ncbi:MAG: hypothetical protein GYA17_07635, partial [Chloroflexi bacterium]|nr:hypothetical protein [Chloroflexota bacterium]